jgi:hypothetical protein
MIQPLSLSQSRVSHTNKPFACSGSTHARFKFATMRACGICAGFPLLRIGLLATGASRRTVYFRYLLRIRQRVHNFSLSSRVERRFYVLCQLTRHKIRWLRSLQLILQICSLMLVRLSPYRFPGPEGFPMFMLHLIPEMRTWWRLLIHPAGGVSGSLHALEQYLPVYSARPTCKAQII